ncbi:trigger factor [Vagococcus xieshaowenii]|uniref:Trigger factor n=1 Tax=Vagococcus xieshaowenii TaxID=2562451 RepID=A0AAJ5EGL6_9ENTE|nr:trigger factor [Vagococcus xieshaowenii]QCA28312.1 trigger factor [Vagococcus xieshaowenii]TFZ42300.1 trigger factor [Vagococcus xieshaowenii]
MTAKWEKKGTNDGVLSFEISQELIQPELTKTFNKVKRNISVPGFRKGKISRQMFNKMYGEAALYEDTLNALLPAAYDAAVQEAGIEPVAQPQVNVEKMEAEGAWEITAEVTVKPEVKLGEYKNLTVEKQDREVTEEEVDATIEEKRQSLAELVLKEDDAAEAGDTVVIDYKGMKDGVAFDGGTAENQSLELGSNTFIPGFEEQLIGAKAGDAVEVKVTFPEEYHSEDLAGADAVFEVTVHEVKAKELPELDDEFAKDADEEVETFAEYKEKVRASLVEAKEKAAKEKVEELAIEQAVANAEIVELPHVMVHDEVHRAMDEYLGNMQRQGISPELYYQITGTTEADLHKQFEADADKRVKTSLVIEAVAAAEATEVTEEDINNEIKTLSATYGMEEDAIRKALTPEMLKHDIVLKKALDVITETAKEA